MMVDINIANDFSRFPLGRKKRHSNTSGEAFREDILIPALRQNAEVVVELDGTTGYPSSFLEEAFGGLVRAGFAESELHDRLKLSASDPSFQMYVDLAWEHIHDAARSGTARHH